MLYQAGEGVGGGGWGGGEGGGVWKPPKLSDIICEQPLMFLKVVQEGVRGGLPAEAGKA